METRLHSVCPNWRTTRTPGNASRSAAIVGAGSAAPVLVNIRTGGGGSLSRRARVAIIAAREGTMGTTVALVSRIRLSSTRSDSSPARTISERPTQASRTLYRP